MTHDDSAGAGFFEKSDHDGPAANFQKSNFLTRKDDAVPFLVMTCGQTCLPRSSQSKSINQRNPKKQKSYGAHLIRFFSTFLSMNSLTPTFYFTGLLKRQLNS